jgi:hypothetical protein
MNSARDSFYQLRDDRTRAFGVPDSICEKAVRVAVGPMTASTIEGQVAVLALVNMLSRIHRSLILDIPHLPLHRSAIVPGRTLDEVAVSLAKAIDPFIELSGSRDVHIAIGVGPEAPPNLQWYIGSLGQIAVLARRAVPITGSGEASLGACLASCLGSAAILRTMLGLPVREARLSAWNFGEGGEAEVGPDTLGPVDVGSVLQIGAGAVGLSLDYWLHEFCVMGPWSVVDADTARLHNTNRSLGMLAADAGWPGGMAKNKALIGASLIRGTAVNLWYDQYVGRSGGFDLVIPVANERGVREAVASRGAAVVVHATTSMMWESQVHRHIAGADDCTVCRMPPEKAEPDFTCSKSIVRNHLGSSSDAALPFLSATAGLLLMSALYRLQYGDLNRTPENFWAIQFQGVRNYARSAIFRCNEGCQRTLAAAVRDRVNVGRRWSGIRVSA